MPTRPSPSLASSRFAKSMTWGVLPVPPNSMLPTTRVGMGDRSLRSRPQSYSACLVAKVAYHRADNGTNHGPIHG